MTWLTLYGSSGTMDSEIIKTIRLPAIQGDPHEQKRADAIRQLGNRCVLHPSRRVPKGNYETPTMKANVAETIARERKRLERAAKKDNAQ